MKQHVDDATPALRNRRAERRNIDVLDVVFRRLETFGPLSDGTRLLVRRCAGGSRDHAPHVDILRAGETLTPIWFVSGWACRQRTLDDGRRQIINFILPGDGIGFHNRRARTSSCGITALTAVRTIDGTALAQALNDPAHHDAHEALHRQSAAEETLLCDQIVRLGRRNALERVAHLLLELSGRLMNVGLATDDRFELPLTQDILADAVGLSVVHINRTLQQMKREGAVELRGGHVRSLDPAAMRAIADDTMKGA